MLHRPREGVVGDLLPPVLADETMRAAVAENAGLQHPAEVAASLVLLRDAALVGGYLDGEDRVSPAFARTARSVIEAHRAP